MGTALVVGRKRVPHPAAGTTTVLTLVGDGIVLEPGLGPGLAEEVSLDYAAGERGVGEGGEVEGGRYDGGRFLPLGPVGALGVGEEGALGFHPAGIEAVDSDVVVFHFEG